MASSCHAWQWTRSNLFAWHTSKVTLNQVWQSYPETLWRKLFSSVPRRPHALANVTLTVEGGQLLILQGASSSGKSTILRLIAGEEIPVQGSVIVSAECQGANEIAAAQPISLGQNEFPCSNYYDERNSMNEILDRVITHELKAPSLSTQGRHRRRTRAPPFFLEAAHSLAYQLCHVCELSKSTGDMNIIQLSPSEFYRWGLVIASLQSILPSAVAVAAEYSTQNESWLRVPTPILLLDEWMDLETSGIVRTVESSLIRFAQVGAVIVCVTHKPHLFGLNHPSITMCRGEILCQT